MKKNFVESLLKSAEQILPEHVFDAWFEDADHELLQAIAGKDISLLGDEGQDACIRLLELSEEKWNALSVMEKQELFLELASTTELLLFHAQSSDGDSGPIFTTPLYWDCECHYKSDDPSVSAFNYIHDKRYSLACPKCGTEHEDQPDSRVREVLLMLLSHYPALLERIVEIVTSSADGSGNRYPFLP